MQFYDSIGLNMIPLSCSEVQWLQATPMALNMFLRLFLHCGPQKNTHINIVFVLCFRKLSQLLENSPPVILNKFSTK